MKGKKPFVLLFWVLSACCSQAQTNTPFSGSQADRDSLVRTSILIRRAFGRGNVNDIMKFHHPDVSKALGYDNYQKDAAAVRAALAGTLENFHLDFVDNQTESLFINGNTAVEQTLFTIKGTPSKGGQSFIFKGRSMIVYVRYPASPTGWATIREQIQPAESVK